MIAEDAKVEVRINDTIRAAVRQHLIETVPHVLENMTRQHQNDLVETVSALTAACMIYSEVKLV